MRSVPGTKTASIWVSGLLVVCAGVTGAFLGANRKAPAKAGVTDELKGKVAAAMSRLPLTFQENRGQSRKDVRFVTRGAGYSFWLSPTSTTLALAKLKGVPAGGKAPASVIRMRMVGANPKAKVRGAGTSQGKTNYLIGADSKKWVRDIPNFSKVRYTGIYNGVDLEYYGNQQELEHDFIVKPGADPSSIRLAYDGVQRTEITLDGELNLHTPNGTIEQKKPIAYQNVGGKRREVPSHYTRLASNEIGFEVGEYDVTKPLVIDPVLRYSTYVGGSMDDYGFDIAIDVDRNVYVTGYTGSYTQAEDLRPAALPVDQGSGRPNVPSLVPFPTINPYQADRQQNDSFFLQVDLSIPGNNSIDVRWDYSFYDAFVFKLNNTGSDLIFATYLGAESDDYGLGIAVDSNRNPYITGRTNSVFWPLHLPVQGNGGGGDAFVTKLSTGGNSLVYSTYLGGSSTDLGRSIAVDSTGNAHIAGFTSSTDFPTFQASQAAYGGGARDAFVTSLDASGSAYNYSTYLGGGGDEGGVVAGVDLNYVPDNMTLPYNVSLPNPYAGIRFPADTGPANAVPLGVDYTIDLAVDPQGYAVVTGGTTSTEGNGFPTTPGVVGPTHSVAANQSDVFVTKYMPDGQLAYSTFLGGSSDDAGRSVALNNLGEAFITGYTLSTNFPTLLALQGTNHGGVDAFVTKLDNAGGSLIYSTYLGGAGMDIGNGIAVSGGGQAYVAGSTTSTSGGPTGFPTANFFQSNLIGGTDIFVSKLRPDGSSLEYSTYLGGTTTDRALSIALDSRAQAYIAGITSSGNLPTAQGSYDRGINTGSTSNFSNYGPYPNADAMVAKFHAPPFAASNLIATDVQLRSVSIAWTDQSDNEDGFDVERKLGGGPTGTWTVIQTVGRDQVTFADTGLVPTTTYSYRVRPFNDDGITIYYGPYSNQLVVTTLPEAPASPTNFTATALDTQRIRLSWTDTANNEESYILERRSPPLGIFEIINGGNPLPGSSPATATGGTLTFTDTGLTANTTYEYRLRARNVAGDSPTPYPTVQATTLAPAPTVKPVVTVTTVSNSALRVDWTYAVNPADHIGFKIFRKGPGDPSFSLLRTTPDRGTTFQDNGLTAGSTYCYRVLAYNASGDGPQSDPPAGVCGDTLPNPPAAPTNLRATLTAPNTAVLVWTDNSTGPEETGFKIEGSTDNFATAPSSTQTVAAHVGTGDVNPVSIPGLQANTVYYYRVVAFSTNAGGDSTSPPTNIACLITLPNAPTNLAVANLAANANGDTRLVVSWTDGNPVTNTASTFRVQRSTNSGGPFTTIAVTPTGVQGGSWSVTDTGLQANTTYYYQVNAFNVPGAGCDPNSGGASTVVGPVSGLTRPAAPTLNSVVEIAPTTHLRLTWTDNSPVKTNIRIERTTDSTFNSGVTTVNTAAAGTTTWDDTTTAGNVTYYYRLVAVNTVGDSAPSSVGSRLTLPGQPQNVSAKASEDVNTAARIQIDLTWTDGSAAPTAFKVEMSTTGAAGTYTPVPGSPTAVGATSLRIGNLNPALEYCFRVRGTNATGDGANSTVACPPAGPTGLTATVVSDTQIRLQWEDRSSTETDFHIERVTGVSFATGTNHVDLYTGGPNINTYLDGGLSPNTTYTYRVTAVGDGGTSAPSREAGATTLRTAPASATNLVATAASASQINLTWDHTGTNLSGFTLERSTNSAFPNGSTTSFTLGDVRSYSDTGLSANVTYYYRVTAVNGTSKAAASNTASALTYPAKPSNLMATAIGDARIDLTWTDNSAVPTDFKIERKQGVAGSYTEIGVTTAPGTTYSDTMGLLPGTSYTYRVRATNATGNSDYSDEATATTLPSKPTAPSGLLVTTVSQTALRLNWTDTSNNETGFKIERSPNGSNSWRQIGTAGQDVVTFLDQGLLAETTYFYRVTATNAGGDSTPSNVASGTTLPNLPSAPSGLTVTVPAAPDGSTKLVLTWTDASSNESGFKIERSNDNFASPANTTLVVTTGANVTTYTNSGLTPDTVYYYRVRATNAAGDSANTSTASARTLVAAPTAPSGLTVTALSASSLRVDWTNTSNNEDSFKLERSTDGTNFVQVATPAAGATTFTDIGLNADTRYYYRVRATNAGGDSAASNTGNAKTFAAPPAAPSNLAATVISSSQINLTWDDNSSTETGFKVERKLVGGQFAPVQTVGANVRTFTDTGLAADTTYVYHVIATNLGGDSAPSNEATAKTLPTAPSAPTGLTATALSQTQIRLNWTDASNNETGFKIERSPDGNSPWSVVNTAAANANAFTDSGLIANTEYSYRVRATNAGGDSAPSNQVTVRTNPVAPGTPSNLTATALSQTSVFLNWTAGTGVASSFKVERKLEGGSFTQIATTGAGETTYTDNQVSAALTYVYRVRANNAGGDSGYSNEAAVITLPNIPVAPTNVTVTALSSSSLKIEWSDNSSNETGFKIARTNGGTFTVDPNVTSYTDTGLTANTVYSYTVRAVNGAGDSAADGPVSGTTLPVVPNAPSSLTVAVQSLSALALNWTDNSSTETGFKVERRIGPSNAVPFIQVQVLAENTTSWVDTEVEAGQTYTYRVLAFNSGGDSAPSNEVGVQLSASGKLQVSVKSVAFGKTPIGRTKIKTFKIKNTGRTSLQGNVGTLVAPFRVSVGSGSFNLAAGRSITVKVEYTPTAAERTDQNLEISSTDPVRQLVRLPVNGTGTGQAR